MDCSLFILPCLVILFVFVRSRRKLAQDSTLPLGPKPLPLIGNLLQFPTKEIGLAFEEWKKLYGDIVYVNILGKPTIILNSRAVCMDLLEKRSAIYSSRPRAVMVNELMEFDWNFGFAPYSPRWRQYRQLFHQFFNQTKSKDYIAVQERCVQSLLLRLLQDPHRFMEHTRLLFGDMVLQIIYGIKADSLDNEIIQAAEEAVHALLQAGTPGRFLVDLLPFMKYIPSWIPGANFQTEAATGRKAGRRILDLPVEYIQSAQKKGNEPIHSSVYTEMVEKCQEKAEDKHVLEPPVETAKSVAALAYIAGADTTVSAIHGFFLVIANHAEVQQMAQVEIERVVGADRLPTYNDIQYLPYTCAVVKELLRWHVIAPLSIPQATIEDDVYNGYFIPKGSTILQNTKGILHDPDVYPEPDAFKPSRWLIETANGVELDHSIPDPDAAFGLGRRSCPGQYFTINSLQITIANVLACFNISPLDDSGKPCMQLPYKFTDGLLVRSVPYKVSITPRTEKVSQTLASIG